MCNDSGFALSTVKIISSLQERIYAYAIYRYWLVCFFTLSVAADTGLCVFYTVGTEGSGKCVFCTRLWLLEQDSVFFTLSSSGGSGSAFFALSVSGDSE